VTRECGLGVVYCTMHSLRNIGNKGAWETSVASYSGGACWRGSRVCSPRESAVLIACEKRIGSSRAWMPLE
jgi:hypothetical protein